MNILVLGSGGREHALAWKISQSDKVSRLFVAPGNAGTIDVALNINLDPENFEQVERFCIEEKIELLVVGPEAPLVKGIKDYFKKSGKLADLKIIGPDANGAQLEGSKDFSKKFMKDYNIPTAEYQSFTKSELTAARAFLQTLKAPYVLKADGLAGGKGVIILDKLESAEEELEQMLNGKFGDASSKVVIEEFLDGIEFSVFVITDGKDYRILPVAKDYKRIGEGDTGLNTGGMGAVSPVTFVDDEMLQKVKERIIEPTIKGIKEREMDYTGFIFFGLINVQDEPKVIEYNVRMGDPETEVVIPRVKSDLVELLNAAAEGDLVNSHLVEDERFATTVMTVAEGYPGTYEKGKEISGLQNVKESIVFHAGTKKQGDKVVTNGGRIIAFTSFGKTKDEALQNSYSSINKICFDGITYRKDIGFDL